MYGVVCTMRGKIVLMPFAAKLLSSPEEEQHTGHTKFLSRDLRSSTMLSF